MARKIAATCCLVLLTTLLFSQWVHRSSGSASNIYNAQLVSTYNGFWVGESGISQTINYGQTWSSINDLFFNELYFTDLHFVNGSTGVITGSNDIAGDQEIWYTVNGGTNWSEVYSVAAGSFPASPKMSFIDNQNGFGIIGSGNIIQTTNGGLAWAVVGNIPQNPGGICFTSTTVGYVVTDTSILKTTDGGVSWSTLYHDGSLVYWLSDVHFVNDTTGFVSDLDGAVFKTTNAGLTWTKTLVTGARPSRFFFLDANNGFIGDDNYNSDILQTTNGGLSWEEQTICPAGTEFYAVTFNGGTGVAVGNYGALYTNENYTSAPGKPFAIFSNTNGFCDSVLQFTNNSYTGYQSSWYFDGQYAANTYNYSHPAVYGTGYDTVMLVVSNGTNTGSSILSIPRIKAAVMPDLSVLHFTADTVCPTSPICVTIDTSNVINTYTMFSNGTSVYSFTGIGNSQGHCINYLTAPIRLVVTVSNTGTCQTLTDSVVKQVHVVNGATVPVTVLDTLVCANGTVRVRLDSTQSYYKYYIFQAHDTLPGNSGSIILTDTLHNNPYDTVISFYVAQISVLGCNVYGETDSVVKVHVRLPDVNFTALDSMVYTGTTINLQNHSHADSYIWQFDNTASQLTANTVNASVYYTQPGEKQIMLIGNTTQHCAGDTMVKFVYVGDTIAPDPTGGLCFANNIDTATYPEGGILAYHVDCFGNNYTGGYAFGSSFNGADYNTATYAYLRKTDKQGNLVWYISVPTAMPNDYQYYSSYITGITTDPQGNVYVSGDFGTTDNFQFGSLGLGYPGVIVGAPDNGPNFFAAKFDSSGNGLWMIASYQQMGDAYYLGASDIQYADDGHIYLAVIKPNSNADYVTVQYNDTLVNQRLSSLNIIQINSNGHLVNTNIATAVSQRLNSNYYGSIYSVINPDPNAIVALRNGVMGPHLFVHPDCSVSIVGFFVDSINFTNTTGIHAYTDIVSCFTANVDPVQGWQSAHTLFGSNLLSPEYSTLLSTWPYDDGITDWMPRFDFDSHKNIYITTHIDTLYLKDTVTYTNSGNYYGLFQNLPQFSIVAKFDANGKLVWQTQNRNYTGAHHITGINLSADESELVLTGYYSNGLNLTSTHRPATLLHTGLNIAPFIAAMDTAGDVQWIDKLGTDTNTSVISAKTGNGNLYALGLSSGHTHELKYNLAGNCNAADISSIHVNCNELIITLTNGSIPFCQGDSITLMANPSTAVAGANYNWSINGTATGSNSNTLLISHPVAGEVVSCLLTSAGGDTLHSNTITLSSLPVNTPTITRRQDSLTATYGLSYTWYLNGNLISANTQTIPVQQQGNYVVVVKDTAGCSAASQPYNVLNIAISQTGTELPVKVYPSPNNGSFMIEVPDAANAVVTITDMLGNQLYTQPITASHQLIDAQQLPAGLYVVSVKTSAGVQEFRVVRE